MISSKRFAVPFRVGLRGSFLLAGMLLFVYGGALVLLSQYELAWGVKLVLMAAVAASFVLHFRRSVMLLSTRAVSSVVNEGGEDWLLNLRNGEVLDARLLGSSFAHPWMTIMHFAVEGQRRMRAVVIMPDATDSTSYRRLLVRLRNGAATAAA